MHHTLRAEHLTVSRSGTRVLTDVSFPLAHGETIGVLGPNGSGKSTLVGALIGAIDTDNGAIEYSGVPLHTMTRRDIATRVAVVAQTDDEGLPLPVRKAVALGRLPFRSGYAAVETTEDAKKIDAALAATNLTEKKACLTTQLSGGEKQRVAIARALAQDTDFLLLDEPTNHLDLKNQLDLLELIKNAGKTTLLVLHDLNLAARYCSKVLLLDQGRAVCYGTPREVLTPVRILSTFGVRATPVDVEGIRQFVFLPA